MKKSQIALLAAGCCVVLDSCWFNSTGRIINSVNHTAKVYASDAKIGDFVRSDGVHYYVKLDHVYNDEVPNLLAFAFNDNGTSKVINHGAMWYEVNGEFAQYITGQRSDLCNISWVRPVSESVAMTGTTGTPIVREHRQVFNYRHVSPNAGWAYTGAAMEFICVDVPISLTLNALGVVFFWCYLKSES